MMMVLEGRLKHLGAPVRPIPAEWGVNQPQGFVTVGLTLALRWKTKRAAWVVKRIVKALNDLYCNEPMPSAVVGEVRRWQNM